MGHMKNSSKYQRFCEKKKLSSVLPDEHWCALNELKENVTMLLYMH